MKIIETTLFSAFLTVSLLATEPLYTQEGADLSFAAAQESSGGKPGERFNRGGALGSRIHVNRELLEKQVGKTGPIPKGIGLHTEFSGGISRKDFGKAKDNKISFRWGMYAGSKKGQNVPNDALLFVTGATIR